MDKYINANIIFSKFCNGYSKLKQELPIRPSEMGVLNIIVQREGNFTPLKIAELLEVSKPMITAHITVLEKKGYISKEYSKEDKRSFYIIPTKKAVELVKETSKKMQTHLQYLETSLGTDTFNELLDIMLRANEILKNIEGDNL